MLLYTPQSGSDVDLLLIHADRKASYTVSVEDHRRIGHAREVV